MTPGELSARPGAFVGFSRDGHKFLRYFHKIVVIAGLRAVQVVVYFGLVGTRLSQEASHFPRKPIHTGACTPNRGKREGRTDSKHTATAEE